MAERRRPMLVGASVAALLVLGSGVPALAEDNTPISTFTTPDTICSYVHHYEDSNNGHEIRILHQLRASAIYDENWVTNLRMWRHFRYRVDIRAWDLTREREITNDSDFREDERTSNNVNIRVKEAGTTTTYTFNSPDNRVYGQQYVLAIAKPPSTRMISGVEDLVEFQAIFDHAVAPDPDCNTWRWIG
jgi:hypothetical protein